MRTTKFFVDFSTCVFGRGVKTQRALSYIFSINLDGKCMMWTVMNFPAFQARQKYMSEKLLLPFLKMVDCLDTIIKYSMSKYHLKNVEIDSILAHFP